MLKINALKTSTLQQYIKRYQSWRIAQNLYSEQEFAIVNDSSGIPCFNSIDVDQINNCRSDVVVIDNIKEGLHQYKAFSQYNKDKKYLIVSGSQWNSELYNWGFDCQVVWHNYYWYMLLETLANPGTSWFYQPTTYTWHNKPWQFYSLTTQPRPHRLELIKLLQQNLIGKNWVFRNNHQDHGVGVNDIDLVDTTQCHGSDQQFPNRYKHFDQSFLAAICALDLSVANRCWYHLITESDFDLAHSFTPTEKTFKTLLTGQPFVVVGTQYFLKNLQSLGFKTYNELWDESYDLAEDTSRLKCIVKLCQELEHFDWQCAKPKLQEIACHNRAQLLNLNTHADREFAYLENQVVDFCNKWM